MTWRRAGQIYLVLAVLAAYVLFVDGGPRQPTSRLDPAAPERSLLGTDEAAVDAVAFHRHGAVVRASRDGARWRVVEPAAAEVPSDLVAAAVATLTAGQVSEVMVESAGAELASFGLAAPTSEIEVTMQGAQPRRVRVLLGANNPTNTAIYAKRDDGAAVFLVGMNLRYYTDLIFQAGGLVGP